MKFLKHINPALSLRFGLGLTYLYSGSALIMNPQDWYAFVPYWITRLFLDSATVFTLLQIQGLVEFVVGLLFLAWFLRAWAVTFATFYAIIGMSFILIFSGIDLITFRDIGLLGAAISLFLLLIQQKKTNA